MRVPDERLSLTYSRTHRIRADGGRRLDGADADGTAVPGSLIVVSNRQPYRHEYDDADDGGDGRTEPPTEAPESDRPDPDERSITVDEPTGGLTAGLDPVLREQRGTWIAWGDGDADFDVTDDSGCVAVPPEDEAYTLGRVDLSEAAVDGYYYGFSNRVLWPLCHELPHLVDDRPTDLEWYRRVNERFADAVIDHADADSVVWFQDYHFAFAPKLVSEATPRSTTVAQFWHIPWPTPSIFAACPARDQLLTGLLGADLLGFHVDRYVTNFLESVDRFVPAATVDYRQRTVEYDGSKTQVVATPMGVDADSYDREARSAKTDQNPVLEDHDVASETVLGLGVDRLDYSKGILDRLVALERFFERNPAWQGEFTFVQKATPSRTDIPAYERYGKLVREEVERINDRFETDDWQPIVYTEAYLEHETLCGLYRRADVMIVSPLLDGMNLVTQEYVAASVDGTGTVVLSDQAGAHDHLGSHALSIDPTDVEETATQIERALTMAPHERHRRLQTLRTRVFEADLEQWMESQFEWIRRVQTRNRSTVSRPDTDNDSRERTPPI
ncbi:trehalose-6-phosphate synthase [Salinadaptatus halalkaliphilus]|uniref:Trehalose-6-phosphate synthase n=1 Tax=Salinadaptatus halalkaliphilus TaxID=2419781 RepID=A0A4S3TPF5_9EURY|nr:trehalose-6-phosphate synthase [Salinadaptatus halalkaliphilus]THE66181.1 trehalose-6-phosphate synthase [Salinadaptatus halalkaliphilus]